MGRLYWKFFAFFFFAQVTAVLIVTVAIGMLQTPHVPPPNFAPPRLGVPSVTMPNHAPRHNLRHLFPLMPLVVGFFVSFLFAALLASYFSKPIRQLRQAFERAAQGDLQVRIGNTMHGRRDELADLGNAFDVMVSRINQVLQSQTTLLHQVSHELRSPLSRLQMAIGLLKQQPDKLSTSLNRIERESVRMDSLVGELLTLSRLESGVMALQKESVDLNELLTDLVNDARFEAEAKNVTIQFEHQSAFAIVVKGQQDLLHRAIENVLRNSIKYSPLGNMVNIELSRKSTSNEGALNTVAVLIRDHGAGVSDVDLAHIFTPFYRAAAQTNQENNHANQGYGLGLAIAKQIIESHSGKIEARSPSGGGFEMVIHLPLHTV